MSVRFRDELETLINCNSKENGSDTPDWILADYLVGCLNAFDIATRAREKWYAKPSVPVHTQEPDPETTHS